MKRVLIVSRAFPPTNAAGAVRVGKLAKYLPEFGWDPIVLTVERQKGVPLTLATGVDEAKIIRIPYSAPTSTAQQKVKQKLVGSELNPDQPKSISRSLKEAAYRLVSFFYHISPLPYFRLVLPDPLGWYRSAITADGRILNEYKFDAIFSSYSPSASHFIASYLQRRANIPWVAEFRDLWSLNPYHTAPRILQFLQQKVEKQVMKHSSLLVTVSEHNARQLQKIHSKNTAVIPNGFDEEDYLEDIPLTSKFTISYTGSTYSGKRDPSHLFEAINLLQQEGKVSPDNFEIRFFGDDSKTVPTLAEKYGIKQLVTVESLIPFKESIRRQKESIVLLLLSWNDPRDRGTYTAKIFEYLGAGRPILASSLFKGGVIDSLIERSGCGIVANEVDECRPSAIMGHK